MKKQPVASAAQAATNPALASIIKAVTTETQAPKASLLGLPKELLNYVITLAVVDDPDADQTALLLEQQQKDGYGHFGRKGKVLAFPSPALARTCTELEAIVLPTYYGQNTFHFCSMKVASYWLYQERRRNSVASVRHIRVHFGVTATLDKDPALERRVLDMYLEDNSQALVMSTSSSFYVGLCKWCQREFTAKVQRINNRGSDFDSGEVKLAVLACYFDRRIRFRKYVCTGCVISDK